MEVSLEDNEKNTNYDSAITHIVYMVEQLYWIAFNYTGMPNKEDCVCLYPSGINNLTRILTVIILNRILN